MTMQKRINYIYFSPTGSTQAVLRFMAQNMNAEIVEYDFTLCADVSPEIAFDPDDFVVLGFPVYAGRVPEIFCERLNCVTGSNTPVAIVCTYGNRDYNNALFEMCEMAKEKGFMPIGAAAVVTEHNVIRSVAAGRPDKKDKTFLEHFCIDLSACCSAFSLDNDKMLVVPGKHKHPHRSIALPLRPVGIKTTADCTACGLCVSECPVGAIPEENPQKTKTNCIGCMRCTRICPKYARRQKKTLSLMGNIILSKAKRVRREPEKFMLSDKNKTNPGP